MHKCQWIHLALSGAALLPLTPAGAVDIELVNRTALASAMDGNGRVERIDAVTPDGRYTLFTSSANNLVTGDTNRSNDLFLHDAITNTLERINVGADGVESHGVVGNIAGISDDGRHVVFDSNARNLSATQTSGRRQVYLRDRSAGTTTLLTRYPSGVAPISDSANARISADGRYVVFDTYAAFVASDDNAERDVYRFDRQTGEFALISVTPDGHAGNRESYEPQISADGSSVVFYTWATNLTPGDTNTLWDLLLSKPATGTMQRVSVKADGSQPVDWFPLLPQNGALSGDGRYVIFNTPEALVAADTNDDGDGYRYDSQTGAPERVTFGAAGIQLDEYAEVTAISRDGRRVLLETAAANVIAAQPRGNSRVFLRDLVGGVNTHVTFRSGAEQFGDDVYSAQMSDDGSVVVAATMNDGYVADDNNDLTDVYRQNGRSSPAERVSRPSPDVTVTAANHDSGDWDQGYAASEDLRYVAFGSRASNLVVGDTNGADDIFVRDRLLGTTERVSVSSSGEQGLCRSSRVDISADGRYVVFHSCSALVLPTPFPRLDVYRHDRLTHTTEVVSLTPQGTMPNSYSLYPSISGDGRYVAFSSCASDLVADDLGPHCDAFVRDMQTNVTTLASRSHDGLGADAETYEATISGDGSAVAFATSATNLVSGDTNGVRDVFVFDRIAQSVSRASVSSLGAQADGPNYLQGISRDGKQILFTSHATNLGPAIPFAGLFVRDRDEGAAELVSRTTTGVALQGNLNTAAISADGRRVAFTTDGGNAGYGYGLKLVLFERDRARLGLVRPMDEYHGPLGQVKLDADGRHLLIASSDNRLVEDDGNNYFVDVFLLGKIEDHLFANAFGQP